MKSKYLRHALAACASALAIPSLNAQGPTPAPAPARLPTYMVVDLGEGTPLAVASDGTTVIRSLTADSPFRNRGGVNELLSDGRYFLFYDMNDRGDIVGAADETAVAILATDPAATFTRWAQMGQFTATSTALSRLTTINENQTVTGYEWNSQRANNIGSGSHRSFVSSAANVLNTVASVSYTINYFTEESHYTGVDYFFRDLNNSGGGIGTKYDFAVNQDYTPLYYGTAPDLSGDTVFKPYALSDANLVAGLSNGVLKLWEPSAGAFQTITVPNPITEDSIRITNCCGDGGAIRITDPPASDPNAEIFILAGDNLILRTAKDVDGNPLPSPIYTVFAAKKLLPKDSPYSNLALKNISNNGIIAATATWAGDNSSHAILLVTSQLVDSKDETIGNGNDVRIVPKRRGNDKNKDSIAWIEAHGLRTGGDAEMPYLALTFPGCYRNGWQVKWKLKVEFARRNGRVVPDDTVLVTDPTPGGDGFISAPVTGPVTLFTSSSWIAEREKGFFGGDAELTFQLFKSDGTAVAAQEQVLFAIGGKNPEGPKCQQYISRNIASAHGLMWFCDAIARSESKDYNGSGSRYNQFWNEHGFYGRNTHRTEHSAGEVLWVDTPGESPPKGFGIFQVTGDKDDPKVDIPREQLWNWQKNVDAGLAIITDKRDRRYAGAWDYLNGIMRHRREPSYPRGLRLQARQDTGHDVPVPTDTVENVTFQDATSRVIEDADNIRMYNGGHYISWDHSTSAWVFQRVNRFGFNYVERVCAEVQP